MDRSLLAYCVNLFSEYFRGNVLDVFRLIHGKVILSGNTSVKVYFHGISLNVFTFL